MMYVVYFATHPDHCKQGVGRLTLLADIRFTRLLHNGEVNIIPLHDVPTSRAPPVKAIAAVFTTPTSQRLAARVNFHEVKSFSYEDFKFKNDTLASKIPADQSVAKVMGIKFVK